MSRSHHDRRPIAALILAAACWGAGTAISKQAVDEIPPLALLPVQLSISVALLAILARRRGDRLPSGTDRRRLSWLGLLNPGLAYALSLAGLTMISASLSVLLWAVEPIVILLLATLLLKERPGVVLVVLSVVAVLGLGLVVYDPAASGAAGGVVLTLAGVGCCAVYTIAARRWLPDADSTLGVVVAQQAYALVLALGLAVAGAAAGFALVPTSVTLAGALSAAASGVAYYGLAYWLYLTGLRSTPASTAAASFYLIPVFGVAAAWLYGERLGAVQLVAAAVVVACVTAITLRLATTSSPQETAGSGLATAPDRARETGRP